MSSEPSRANANPTRYHPALVALHWALAVLILVALAIGFLVLGRIDNSTPQKLFVLRWHAVLGEVILALMALRFVVRLRTAKPAQVTTGHPWLDRIASITHYAFYAVIALMALSGMAIIVFAHLPATLLGLAHTQLPETFDNLPPRIAHGVFARIILALLALHVLGALFHVVVRKDALFRRMWFGGR